MQADRLRRNANQRQRQEVMMTNKLLALMLLITIGGLFGCNTMEGAGKDIQSGGEAVSDTARDVKSEM